MYGGIFLHFWHRKCQKLVNRGSNKLSVSRIQRFSTTYNKAWRGTQPCTDAICLIPTYFFSPQNAASCYSSISFPVFQVACKRFCICVLSSPCEDQPPRFHCHCVIVVMFCVSSLLYNSYIAQLWTKGSWSIDCHLHIAVPSWHSAEHRNNWIWTIFMTNYKQLCNYGIFYRNCKGQNICFLWKWGTRIHKEGKVIFGIWHKPYRTY